MQENVGKEQCVEKPICFSSMETCTLGFFSTLKPPLSNGGCSSTNNFKPRRALVEVSACSYEKFLHFALDETKRRTHLLPSPLQVLFGCLDNSKIWVCLVLHCFKKCAFDSLICFDFRFLFHVLYSNHWRNEGFFFPFPSFLSIFTSGYWNSNLIVIVCA